MCFVENISREWVVCEMSIFYKSIKGYCTLGTADIEHGDKANPCLAVVGARRKPIYGPPARFVSISGLFGDLYVLHTKLLPETK